MKKENFSFNVTEDNASEFAVVSAVNLKRLSDSVQLVRHQLNFLNSQLEDMGVDTWKMEVKTLADLPIYKKPE